MTSEIAVPFARPDIDDSDRAEVLAALDSGWLTTGPRAALFEQRLASVVEARHCVALGSCTAALHLALLALDPRPGQVVVTSPYGFTAAAEVAQHCGLEVAFCDVEPRHLNLDPVQLERVLDRLKSAGRSVLAVIPVHLAGQPCDLEAIDRLASWAGCQVIEDAAHALPATLAGRPIGARRGSGHPAATCFSFYANKTLTTGEGGALVTDDAALARRVRRLSQHGIDAAAWSRESPDRLERRPSWFYEVEEAGFKYNLSDLAAALGLAQLAKVHRMAERRREIAAAYTAALGSLPGLEAPASQPSSESSWHLYVARVTGATSSRERDRLSEALSRRGIGHSVHYRPLHLHAYYRSTLGHRPEDFPVALRESQRAISLPIYSALDEGGVARVIEALAEALAEALRER